MKDDHRLLEVRRIQQVRKIREALEHRVEAAEVRLERLEAQLGLVERRVERLGGDEKT